MKAETKNAVAAGASGSPCSWPDRKLSRSDQRIVDGKKAGWESIRADVLARISPCWHRASWIDSVGAVVRSGAHSAHRASPGLSEAVLVEALQAVQTACLVGFVIDQARLQGVQILSEFSAKDCPTMIRQAAELALMADRYAYAGRFESTGVFVPALSCGWSPLLHKVFFAMAREWRSEMQKAKKQLREWSPATRARMSIDIWLADEWPRGAFKATCAELLERAPKLPGLKVTGKMLRERARELGLAWKTEPGPLVPPVD